VCALLCVARAALAIVPPGPSTHAYCSAAVLSRLGATAGHRSRTRMEEATGVTTYTLDTLRRLRAVTYPANKTLTYCYDGAGNGPPWWTRTVG